MATLLVLVSVLLVSLISLVGIALLSLKAKRLKLVILELVAFSVGALLGDVFIHLLPEIGDELGFTATVGALVLCGFLFSFLIERVIHWHHCHDDDCDEHATKPFATLNLIGDGVHNFIDGIIIAASYLVSVPVGVATTLAVMLHEIPQEIGDYAVLVHGGYTRMKALLMNLYSALAAVVGAALALLLGARAESLVPYVLPFAAGTFLYIAAADLIPELHKETRTGRMAAQVLAILAGVGVMALFLLLE